MYNPPPSLIILFGFLEIDLHCVAVNICRMKTPLGYNLGYKSNRITVDLGGLAWTINL